MKQPKLHPLEEKSIVGFAHCAKCINENLPPDISAGLTPFGIQIWCDTHDCDIVHLTPERLASMIECQPGCDCFQVEGE